MISCHEAEARISRRLDGELPAGLERELREHYEMCPACQTLATEAQETTELLQGALAVEENVLEEIERQILARSKDLPGSKDVLGFDRKHWFVRYPAAAAAGILVGIALWMFVGQPAQDVDRGIARPPALVVGKVQVEPLPVDGDPTLHLKTQTKKILIPLRPQEERQDRGMILELERVDRRLQKLVNHPWQ